MKLSRKELFSTRTYFGNSKCGRRRMSFKEFVYYSTAAEVLEEISNTKISKGYILAATETVSQISMEQMRQRVCTQVLEHLQVLGFPEVKQSGFDAELWHHFSRLSDGYSMGVKMDKAEDVLLHKRLLEEAKNSDNRPVFEIRPVQAETIQTDASTREDAESHYDKQRLRHEIVLSAIQKPYTLIEITTMLAEMGLDMKDTRTFSTNDGFLLAIFVIDGWSCVETELLRSRLRDKIIEYKVKRPDTSDGFEIDLSQLSVGDQLKYGGEFINLHEGSYKNQKVVIKQLVCEDASDDVVQAFKDEVSILREIVHKNVVQFVGAWTKRPTFYIVTEYMSKGSVHTILKKHKKHKDICRLCYLLQVGIDVSEGMNYVHQHDVVKVGDFKLARVVVPSDSRPPNTGAMGRDPNTGAYRWAAPEIIACLSYDHMADVYSFGIVLWELITGGEIPYVDIPPLEAAVSVARKGLRPPIPDNTHPKLKELLQRCWKEDPCKRPNFYRIWQDLKKLKEEVGSDCPKGKLIHCIGKGYHH